MTKRYLQSLSQLDLVQVGIKMHVLPVNFLAIREPSLTESLLDNEEHLSLIDEIYELLLEQHMESLDDLASPLLGSLHKFELELDQVSGLIPPLNKNSLTDQLGLTKNKVYLILRDMEWGVIFWQLSTEIKELLQEQEQHSQSEDANLSIVIHESPVVPQFYPQFKVENKGYASGSSTNLYSFNVRAGEYKRYVFLRNDCSYYWAEIYHYNYRCKIFLARSPVLLKPKLLELPQENASNNPAQQLLALSNVLPSSP